jgi:hypothetical protein
MLNGLTLPEIDGYWYLATPYTKYPGGIDESHDMACRIAASVMQAGLSCFSPIAHCHTMAEIAGLEPLDAEFWVEAHMPMLMMSGGLLVAMMKGWQDSEGVAEEIQAAQDLGIQIVYLEVQ